MSLPVLQLNNLTRKSFMMWEHLLVNTSHNSFLCAENEAYWDEDGNIVCSGGEEDFQLLSEKNQKLFLLQELLASLGLEA